MKAAVVPGRGQLFLALARECVGFAVLGRIVAGLLPQLLALYEQLPGLGWVDLVRTQRSLGEDGEALRKPPHKRPAQDRRRPAATAPRPLRAVAGPRLGRSRPDAAQSRRGW